MRGITTIDSQPGSDTITLWVTSAKDTQARHVNAVEVDAAKDLEDAIDAVSSLTRCCGVLVTNGTTLDGLPVAGNPLTESDLTDLVAYTEAHQHAISEAVRDHKRRTRSASIAMPVFPVSPIPTDFAPVDDTPASRAFATASYLAQAWTAWLKTDEERRRRTIRPRTGETPWIMPESLNSPKVAAFPELFAARVHEQALV
ncbi:hypothetical protein [Nocardioides furvisabuli]|nr:hypothetical protein [Nocardioides furvisabuli]